MKPHTTIGGRCLGQTAFLIVYIALGLIVFPTQCPATDGSKLFATDSARHEWSEFSAAGFSRSVCGIIYDTDRAPCCGVPLGGLSTGCLDIDPNGTFGFCSIFNGYPRQPKLAEPFLGLAVGGKTWVLATKRVIEGGLIDSCEEHGRDPYYPDRQRNPGFWHVSRAPISGVQAAQEIKYWGHYPVADVEYITDAPVAVGLRAWSPFLPGDVKTSDTPAAVFEVHLHNESDQPQRGTLALSYNGPLEDVKRSNFDKPSVAVAAPATFSRRAATGRLQGSVVSYNGCDYALGIVDATTAPRSGGSLGGASWSKIGDSLPPMNDAESGTSVAVDFALKPGESKVIRYLLAWQVPTWGERGIAWHRMNAKVYPSIDDVIAFMVNEHERLLPRILSWQQVVYTANQYPIWLRDSLVNCLSLITEDAYYAQPTGPIANWCSEDGLFGMIEAPRVCPQIECIPCSWYGNLPIVYFFPTLAGTTLDGYRQYQREDGAAPFCFGAQTEMWQANNNHAQDNQIMLNGVCYVDMVYRLWRRTGDDELLRKHFDAVKKSTTLTATMGEAPFPVVGFPPGDAQTEWWEGWPWTGIASHAAGMHLSNLLLAEQMADAAGDGEFAGRCRRWFNQGSHDLEQNNWRDGAYLLYNKPQTGSASDKIMSNQLDAVWADAFLGIKGNAFEPAHIDQTLATIRRTCLHPVVGAVSFAARDGTQELATYGIFPPETLILGMTYLYHGDRDTGSEICQKCMDNIVLRQGKEWDMPNMVNADTGEVRFGTDYYQMMILWALPAAFDRQSIAEACEPNGLVDRVVKAAAAQ
jgi:uncharacterized protein (DUF608 family)